MFVIPKNPVIGAVSVVADVEDEVGEVLFDLTIKSVVVVVADDVVVVAGRFIAPPPPPPPDEDGLLFETGAVYEDVEVDVEEVVAEDVDDVDEVEVVGETWEEL